MAPTASTAHASTLVNVERIAITSEEQWKALRRQDVTASTIGALFGVHGYKTLGELHVEKSGIDLPARAESSVIRRGRILERVVADEVQRERPDWKIAKANDYLRDTKRRIGATPDFYIDENGRRGVLQTKTVASSIFKKQWLEMGVPPFWISLQCVTEMMLDDADFGVVAALVVGDFAFELHIFDVPRHAATEKRIRDAVEAFWHKVDSGQQPTIDYERDGPLLAVLYPRETKGKIIDLHGDNHIIELLEERERLDEAVEHLEAAFNACNNEIKAKLGDAEAAVVPGWRITFKEQHRKEHTVRASSFRVLRCVRETIKSIARAITETIP
jgi:predicted phage-related endonuclease